MRLTDLSSAIQSHRRLGFLVGCLLFGCYMLTYTGVIQSSDGLAMFATAESIVRRGDGDINQLLWMNLQQGSFGPDGDLYSRKGMGMTFLALPLVWLAQQWDRIGLVQAALLLNPILTAWTGGLIFSAAVRLGWSQLVGIFVALSFGLASMAWPYSQTFFSDPVAGWGLFGGFYGLLCYAQTTRKRYLFLGAVGWGIAYLSRAINLLTLPLYAVALAWILWNRLQQLTGKRPRPSTLFVQPAREWILFGLPVVVAGLLSLWWNWYRFGNPFETGYLPTETFSANWLFGIWGLVASPGRGLIWYSPVVVFAAGGVGWFWRRARWQLLVLVGLPLVYLLLYGKWFMWHGGYSWGPRFLVPTLPFLILLSAPLWARLTMPQHKQGRNWWKLVAAVVVGASLLVQWMGVLVPFSLVQDALAADVSPLFAPETFTKIRYSPLVRQWHYLTGDYFHAAWWRSEQNRPDWLALALLCGNLIAVSGLLLRQMRQSPHRSGPQTGAPPDVQIEQSVFWIYSAGLLLVVVALLVRYQIPLSGAATAALVQEIQANEAPGDAVLHLQPLQTQAFANAYHGVLPVYGHFPVDDLNEEQRASLERLQNEMRRLWVVPDFALPERSGWERSLRSASFLLRDDRPASEAGSDQRLVLFALPSAQPLTETGVGVEFGAPAWVRLNGYALPEQVRPGGELLVALEWESLRPVSEDYHVFVHLLNQQGERLAQRDGQPQLWLRPTSGWRVGERIVDRYALLLDPTLPAGPYRIAVGLYEPTSGAREPISVGPGDAVELGPIDIAAGDRSQ